MRKVFIIAIIIAFVLSTGYLMKDKMIVYNYVDTYYVFSYFTMSLLCSAMVLLGSFYFLLIKTLLKYKKSKD